MITCFVGFISEYTTKFNLYCYKCFVWWQVIDFVPDQFERLSYYKFQFELFDLAMALILNQQLEMFLVYGIVLNVFWGYNSEHIIF
jgi:hypothetical protein